MAWVKYLVNISTDHISSNAGKVMYYAQKFKLSFLLKFVVFNVGASYIVEV